PCHPVIRSGVLLGTQQSREESERRPTSPTATRIDGRVGESSRRILCRNRLADDVRVRDSRRRFGSWELGRCLAWGEEVSDERHCMRCREPRQSLRISPAHPRAAISRVLFLFQAHQRIPIRRLSHVYGLLFRDSARARDPRGGLAVGQGEAHSGPAAAELVTPGTVLGSQHSHLCCCFIPRNWSGNARLVATCRLTLASRLARKTLRRSGGTV